MFFFFLSTRPRQTTVSLAQPFIFIPGTDNINSCNCELIIFLINEQRKVNIKSHFKLWISSRCERRNHLYSFGTQCGQFLLHLDVSWNLFMKVTKF